MLWKHLLIPIALFLFFLSLYLHNLSPGVFGGDVGDLVTASYVFGVAHPPGYPLFTLLGFIFSHIISVGTVAFRVGLVSTLASAFGVLFFYLTIYKLTKSTLLSFLTACILGVNYLYWFYAEIAEVFALNNVFLCILFLLAIFFTLTKKRIYFFLLAFFSGLSLTNHQTIVLIFPSLVLIVFTSVKEQIKKDWKILLYSVFLFLCGLIVYLYIPFAASKNPVVNWDQVQDIQSFIRLVLRQDYGTFSAGLFSPPTFLQRLLILQSYLFTVISQLTIPVIFISLFGVYYLLRIKKTLTVALLLAWILTGPFFIAYAGFPLYSPFNIGVYERFFILSSIVLLFFFPFGLLFFVKQIKPFFRAESLYAMQIGFFIIPFMLFMYNFPKTNLRSVFIGDNLAKDILRPLPKNSVLFLGGDTILFNAWYIRYVLQYRSDVTLFNINGLLRDPYFLYLEEQFKKKHPKITNKQNIVAGTVLSIAAQRPVFSIQEIKADSSYGWIPYGLTFQLVKKSAFPSKETYLKKVQAIWHTIQIPNRSNKQIVLGSLTISEIPSIYSNALLTNGYYFFHQYKDTAKAEKYFTMAELVDGENPKVYTILGVYNYTMKKNCKKAEEQLRRAIVLDPYERLSYFTLYSLSKTCYKETKLTKEIETAYEKRFLITIQKDMRRNQKNK